MGDNFLSAIRCKVGGEWLDPAKMIFITTNNSWIIGPYYYLSTFATNLRANKEAQQALMYRHDPENPGKELKPVKFGRRRTDEIPVDKIMKGGFRELIKGQNPDADLENLNIEVKKRSCLNGVIYANDNIKEKYRLTDLYTAAGNYFSSITLESHHIVEKSMLKKAGKNTNDLADPMAPCVLLKGELHRRLFTPEGTIFRNNWNKKKEDIKSFYNEFYSSPEFSDLKEIAELIINRAFHPVN